MHLSRRMRLIWHKLWLIPLVGATADVVASEAAKLGGVTVPIPWLFSAIGVAGMLLGAVVRAYSVPLIPEGLETPDEALTRRSRVLGERLGATPVRVFVGDLPKLRGKVDTFLDGHDLFVSKRVAELPEAERDFVLARALAERGPLGGFFQAVRTLSIVFFTFVLLAIATATGLLGWSENIALGILVALQLVTLPFNSVLGFFEKRRLGPPENRIPNLVALRATGELLASISALNCLADTEAEKKQATLDADALEKWWNATGQKAVEASEWYQRERSLAAKAE